MNSFKISICVFAMIFIFNHTKAQDTTSCDLCTCPSSEYQTPIGVMIDRIHIKGQWMISYRYTNNMFQGSRMGTDPISSSEVYNHYLMSSDKMNKSMHMIMLMYGLSDRITLMAMTDYMSHDMQMSMVMYGHSGHASDMKMTSTMKSSGFGDTKFHLLYALIKSENHQLLLSGGVNIPTGSISKRGVSMIQADQKYSYSLQTGTGSFGLLPGLTYTGISNSFCWGAQVLGDIKTSRNKDDYQWGNELNMNSWLSYSWNQWLSNSIRLNANARGKMKGFDSEIAKFRTIDQDADAINFGGQTATVFAGANITFPEGFCKRNKLGIEFGIPFYQNLNGIQMSSKASIIAGWQYTF